ncbi:MAG TPA: ChaN family lipoprotein, partial [Kiloniellaceae bacterium]|nr:ChaN family lipoprotein [Kiloniellaceae bacterium]
ARVLPALACCLLLLLDAGAAAAPAALLTDHPLAGTLWDTRSGARTDERQLLAEAAQARWVLIGEKHDNATHHRLQARIVDALGSGGRRLAVVWEMAEPEHAQALQAARLDSVAALGEALAWEARGWPAWPEYQPIAEAALRHGLPMYPGKPARALVRSTSRGEPLPEDLAQRLAWQQPYPPGIEAALLEELRDSHCGALPEAALDGMLRVQRLWDAWMADSLLAAGPSDGDSDGAILIAGSGHAREDRAVPWHLRQRGAGESLTLALVEVIRGREVPGDYVAFDAASVDYVWFTPRVDEDDPCAGMPQGPAQAN